MIGSFGGEWVGCHREERMPAEQLLLDSNGLVNRSRRHDRPKKLNTAAILHADIILEHPTKCWWKPGLLQREKWPHPFRSKE